MFHSELAKTAADHRPYCPACESNNSILNGKRNGVQTYHCKDCGKYFNHKSGSSFQYLKKAKQFFQYAKDFNNHSTIRKDALKFKVSKNTMMSWRKKLYISISQRNDGDLANTGNIEIIHEPIQVKGSHLPKATRIKTSKNIDKNEASIVIYRHDAKCLIIQSQNKINGEKSALQLAKKQMKQFRKKKEPLPAMKKKNKPSSIQSKQVSDYLFRFAEWSKRFRGLSTKYKQCYYNWFRHFIEDTQESNTISSQILKLLLQEKTYHSYLRLIATPQVRIQWVDADVKTA